MRISIILSLLFYRESFGFNLCVVGAGSGLGKELVYQASLNKNKTILALSGNNNNRLTLPCRTNSFNEINSQPLYFSPNIRASSYWLDISRYKYDHIVFTTGAKPFENDYSDKLMEKFFQDFYNDCKSITLVSADGVRETLKYSSMGIKVMNDWYLKDVYRSKNQQERMLIDNFPNMKKFIYRPPALSYGKTLLKSVSRMDLASSILNNIDNLDSPNKVERVVYIYKVENNKIKKFK